MDHANQADNGGEPPESTINESRISHSHRFPWLHYQSEGEDRPGRLIPFNTDDDEITLPYSSGAGVYNLDDNISWMVPGRLYEVFDVEYAIEAPFAP